MNNYSKYIKVSDYAKLYNKSYRTILNHFHLGKIPGYQDKDTKTVYIENPEYYNNEKISLGRAILYARVSSSSNKKSLEGQLDRLRLYALSKGFKIISEEKEIASGLNENRKVFNKILDKTENYDILIVEHKDRLTRFGFSYIERYLLSKGVRLLVINETNQKNKDEELINDFVSIVTSFCQRIYGSKRKNKTLKIIKEIKDNNE